MKIIVLISKINKNNKKRKNQIKNQLDQTKNLVLKKFK